MTDIRAQAWDVTRDFFQDLSLGLAGINPHLWWQAETHQSEYSYLHMACSWMKVLDPASDAGLDIEFEFNVEKVGICFEVTAYFDRSSVNAFPDFERVLAPSSPGEPLFDDWVEGCVQDAIAYVRQNYDKIAALVT